MTLELTDEEVGLINRICFRMLEACDEQDFPVIREVVDGLMEKLEWQKQKYQ